MNGWNGVGFPVTPAFNALQGAAANGAAQFNQTGGYTPSLQTGLGFGPMASPADVAMGQSFGGGNGIGGGGWLGIAGLGKNLDTLKMGVGLAGGIANVWSGLQANKLAKQSFNHQKGIMDTNLANQIRSFNLQLDDKLRSRQVVEGTSDASREAARAQWAARDERRG